MYNGAVIEWGDGYVFTVNGDRIGPVYVDAKHCADVEASAWEASKVLCLDSLTVDGKPYYIGESL